MQKVVGSNPIIRFAEKPPLRLHVNWRELGLSFF